MYPTYYFPHLSDQEKADNQYHNEHCIDMLRQSIMCHADTSPMTMRWGTSDKVPLGNTSSQHECVNWHRIDEWAREREVVDVLKPGYLVHLRLGVVMDEGFENRIGLAHGEG